MTPLSSLVSWRAGLFRWFVLGILLVMQSGCGPEVDPEEIDGPPCQSDICWDLTRVPSLKVNDIPLPDRLVPKETHGWKFPVTPGRTYKVRVRVTSGQSHTYVSSSHIIDPQNNQLTDRYSSRGVTFTAVADQYYIAVQDTGNVQGSDYTARVISSDGNLEPLAGTVLLSPNAEAVGFGMVQNGVMRFMFSGMRGSDYTIAVSLSKGSAGLFLSRIPSVDDDIYELAELFSNRAIKFRAAESAIYYIAVVDRGNIAGSDFTVRVTSP